MMIKHPKMALDSGQCLGCKTRGVVTPQQLRLFAPHVFNMANGPCLKDRNATLHVLLTSMPYRCQAITALSYTGSRGRLSGSKGNKKNLLAPRVTFFMNLKERSPVFQLTGPIV